MFFLYVIRLSAAARELLTLPLISANAKRQSRISLEWIKQSTSGNDIINYNFFTLDRNNFVNFGPLRKMTLTFNL